MQHDSAQSLYIPDKLKVGFQKREGTYTGMLAYVIYYDKKGVLRKEKSWEGWRDSSIEPREWDNTPTEGFVLNKGVGGARQSYGWNARNEYIRVYDPRDFEFEISVANLLFILREGDCSRGKGLEGKFVYAWDGNQLVLLPTHSADYKKSQSFTDLQGKSVRVAELIPGVTYITKKENELIYLGRFPYHFIVEDGSYHHYSVAERKNGFSKKHVFWDGKRFIFHNEVKNIAAVKGDETIHPDYANLVEQYNKSAHGSKVVRLFLKDIPEEKKENTSWYKNFWYYESSPGVMVECYTERHSQSGEPHYYKECGTYFLDPESGVFRHSQYEKMGYAPGREPTYRYACEKRDYIPYREPTSLRLFAQTENGGELQIHSSYYNPFRK